MSSRGLWGLFFAKCYRENSQARYSFSWFTSLSALRCFSCFNSAEIDAPSRYESKQCNRRNKAILWAFLKWRTFSYKLCYCNTCCRVCTVHSWIHQEALWCCEDDCKAHCLPLCKLVPIYCLLMSVKSNITSHLQLIKQNSDQWHEQIWKLPSFWQINCQCASTSNLLKGSELWTDLFFSRPPSFYTPFFLPLALTTILSVYSPPVMNSQISNGPIAQPADQSALTGSEQFLSAKPCLHGSSSFIRIPLRGGKKAVSVYSVFQLIKG